MPLEASWPHHVILLGLFRDVLGRTTRLRCVLGRLLGVLTSSKARLGKVLGRLAGSLGRLDLVPDASWEVLRRLVSGQRSPRDAMSENDQNKRLPL